MSRTTQVYYINIYSNLTLEYTPVHERGRVTPPGVRVISRYEPFGECAASERTGGHVHLGVTDSSVYINIYSNLTLEYTPVHERGRITPPGVRVISRPSERTGGHVHLGVTDSSVYQPTPHSCGGIICPL